MHYYNSNQIERMKVEKNELLQRPTETYARLHFLSARVVRAPDLKTEPENLHMLYK